MMTLRENAFMTLGQAAVLIGADFRAAFGYAILLMAVYFFHLDSKKLVIRDETGPYITRWHLIRTKRFRVFLHRIHRADKDRHVHNHPWPRAFALVLWGGYQEAIWAGGKKFLSWNLAGATSTAAFKEGRYHRITYVLPNTWTLFFAGPRSRDWGFLVDGQHTPCREYLNLPDNHDFGD